MSGHLTFMYETLN